MVSASVAGYISAGILLASNLPNLIANDMVADHARYGINGLEVYICFNIDDYYYHAGGYWTKGWSYNYTKSYEF